MKKILIGVGILVVGGIGYYALSPLWNTIVVDDALPSGAVETTAAEEVSSASEEGTDSTTFPVVGTVGHPASGTVRVVFAGGETVVRYENFSTINGPNLHVYLAKDLDAKEFVDLGPIRGTEGNINYTVPAGVSLEEYPYVMYWCVPFGVLFNYAKLQ